MASHEMPQRQFPFPCGNSSYFWAKVADESFPVSLYYLYVFQHGGNAIYEASRRLGTLEF